MAENNARSPRLLVTLTALFAALCGLYLLIGGVWLVAIGGSWYYPIAGLVMLVVAGLLWRSKRAALWLYAALLLATMIWGVWEVGFDFWALTPRSDCIDSLEVRKKPGGHWIIRYLAGLDLVGLASL